MQNFGKIKNAFNDILVESIIEKDVEKRKIVKRFIRAISESKILKTQFLIYNNIENKTGVNSNDFITNTFVSENIKTLERFSKEDIIKENKRLVDMSQMVKSKLEGAYDKKSLHESITTLIFAESIPSNAQMITDCRYMVINHIHENVGRVVNESTDLIPTSLIANLAVDKFNDKYANLTEDEHRVLKVILEADNDEAKENVFTETLSSCLKSVNKNLSESKNKEKLLDVKEKLLNTFYNKETFSEDISKLLELKGVLIKD